MQALVQEQERDELGEEQRQVVGEQLYEQELGQEQELCEQAYSVQRRMLLGIIKSITNKHQLSLPMNDYFHGPLLIAYKDNSKKIQLQVMN